MRKIYKGINYNKTIIKVLILQGSPRANGNTAWMAEEYKNHRDRYIDPRVN